jgi:hypothetical protein
MLIHLIVPIGLMGWIVMGVFMFSAAGITEPVTAESESSAPTHEAIPAPANHAVKPAVAPPATSVGGASGTTPSTTATSTATGAGTSTATSTSPDNSTK